MKPPPLPPPSPLSPYSEKCFQPPFPLTSKYLHGCWQKHIKVGWFLKLVLYYDIQAKASHTKHSIKNLYLEYIIKCAPCYNISLDSVSLVSRHPAFKSQVQRFPTIHFIPVSMKILSFLSNMI